jgi:hypothetical protein
MVEVVVMIYDVLKMEVRHWNIIWQGGVSNGVREETAIHLH